MNLGSSPHNTAVHGFTILSHIVVIFLMAAVWIGAAFLLFMGAVGVLRWVAKSPVAAIGCFVIVGGITTWIAALFASSWAIAILIGAGAGLVCLAIVGLNYDS